MKIKYLSGPKAGTEEHVEGNVGRFAVSAGLAVQIETQADRQARLPKPGEAKVEPKWSVIELEGMVTTARCHAIKLEVLHQISFYTGDPARIRLIGGRVPPPEIVREYEYEWKHRPELRAELLYTGDLGPCRENERAAQDKAEANKNCAAGTMAGTGARVRFVPVVDD